MDWTNLIPVGFLALAGLLAIYQSRKEGWALNRNVGTLVFLVGATVGMFLDDFLSAGSSLLPWAEPIGAVIMLVGLAVSWI